jgi:inward rectifier potassium channel
MLVAAESIVGLTLVALATGLAFAKFSRPTARMLFSRHPCISPMNGVPTLALSRSWTVLHPIDAASPLHGAAPESLARDEVELMVMVVGYDDTTMQTVHAGPGTCFRTWCGAPASATS